MSYFKRVYANAINPAVCPILALAIVVFSRASSDAEPDRVFPGSLPHAGHNHGFRSFLRKTFGLTGLEYGGVWWCMVVYGGVWWCTVVHGGVWWCMVVYGMVVYGGVT